MKKAIVVTKSEVRQILSQYFNVPIEDVWPSKYSFTILQEDNSVLNPVQKQKVVHKSGT